MNLSRKTTFTASILLAGGLALTGCGSADTPAKSDSSSSQEAPAKGGKLTQDNFAARISKAQTQSGSVHMTMDMGEATGGTFEADMVFDDDPSKVKAHMTMGIGGMDSEIILVDGKMFMNMGEMSQNKYMDLSTIDGGAGDIDAMLDQVNPEAQLSGFTAALTDFSAEPNAEKIDGVQTTKLTLTLDTKRMFSEVPLEGIDIDSLVASLGETMVYEMYVGPDDLPRRIVMPNVAGAGTATTEYSAWGKPVSVSAPAADEIMDGSALFG